MFDFYKYKIDCFYDKFCFYQKWVKTTINTDRSRWLKSINENLKSHPNQFWKSVSQFRENNTDVTHLDIDGVALNKPHDIADAFSIGL
jgi:hypothetical protein